MKASGQSFLSLWMVLLVLVPVVGLLQLKPLRLDLTEDGEYSLAPVTKAMLAGLEDRLQVKLYFNRDIEGAEALLPQRLLMTDLLDEIASLGGDFVEVETVDPTTDLAAMRDAEHVGIEPLQLTGQQLAGVHVQLQYQGLELRYQDRSEVIPFVTSSEFEFAFTVRLAALLRASRPVIGFVSDEPPLPRPMPGITREIPATRIFEHFRRSLGERYAVRDLDLNYEKRIPEDLMALVVARPRNLATQKLEYIDRYLAEGGRVVVLQDFEEVNPATLDKQAMQTGLEDWLASFGVTTDPRLVYDNQSITVPAGVQTIKTPSGNQTVPLNAKYGFGLKLEGNSLSPDHIVTADLAGVLSLWAHPIGTNSLVSGLTSEPLLSSSPQSWLLAAETSLAMNMGNIEAMDQAARQSGAPRSYPLAVAIEGVFPPAFVHADFEAAPGSLVVLGDADLFHNTTFASGAEGNADLAINLMDWIVQDSALIALRSRGHRQRPLTDYAEIFIAANGGWNQPIEKLEILHRDSTAHARSMHRWIAWGNVLGPILLVLFFAILHFTYHRRRAKVPFQMSGGSK
ncbi:MAG: GldG family protein [Planctomycetota bacterium]|nr:GldG family protein [Planctomycetota bacterium]MDA1114462.1 GldG family protein [Planctomycetota bacterium]